MEEKVSEKHQTILNIIDRCKENVKNFNEGKKEIAIITNNEEYFLALGMIFQLAINNSIARPQKRNLAARPLLNAKTNKECIRAFMNVYKNSDIDCMGWQGVLISETLMYTDDKVNVTTEDNINLMIGWITYCNDLGEV